MKGREYLLEKKDDNNDYQPITVFKDKDAAIILLHGVADLSNIPFDIEVKHKESGDVYKRKSTQQAGVDYNNILNGCIRILESEIPTRF
jgi:hypothetical protein